MLEALSTAARPRWSRQGLRERRGCLLPTHAPLCNLHKVEAGYVSARWSFDKSICIRPSCR